MFNKTPVRFHYTNTNQDRRHQTIRDLILRSVAQQRAALAMGDTELAELFARATTRLLDVHLHGVHR